MVVEMADYVIPDEGEVELLEYMVNKTATGDLILKLFTNDITADGDTAYADMTESTVGDYAPITLTGASWTVATAAGVTTAQYAEQTFSFTTSETVYGYYVVNNADDTLLWVHRASFAPAAIPPVGGVFTVVPKLRITSCDT